MPEECLLAYAAGLLDGEGYVTIRESRTRHQGSVAPVYTAFVRIANTHRGVLEWLEREFGGSVRHTHRASEARHRRDAWVWELHSRKATDWLRLVLPWLIVKRHAASGAITLSERIAATPRGLPLTAAEVAARRELYEAVRASHQRLPQ